MKQSDEITKLIEEIVKIVAPIKIMLFNKKTNLVGNLKSFKLCVVVSDTKIESEVAGEIYMNCDCDVPFDVLVYNQTDWDELQDEEGTFASVVASTGRFYMRSKKAATAAVTWTGFFTQT